MPRTEIMPQPPPSQEFLSDGERGTTNVPGGMVAIKAQRVAQTLDKMNQVPPEALINLGGYQIISQEWLSKQPPLAGFFEEGQSLNPSPQQTDDTKRQCWLDNSVYRYNQLGSEWTITQLGARVPTYYEIMAMYENACGTNNAEKMKSMGVLATGFHDPVSGRIDYGVIAYLRSRSPGSYGGMLVVRLRPDNSTVGNYGFKSGAGLVPFGIFWYHG